MWRQVPLAEAHNVADFWGNLSILTEGVFGDRPVLLCLAEVYRLIRFRFCLYRAEVLIGIRVQVILT